jgi:hypothetical protein
MLETCNKVDLSTDTHETHKIPDFILLKQCRVEMGKLKAEIDQLTDDNQKLQEELIVVKKNSLSKEDLLIVKREELYTTLKNNLRVAEKKINELRKLNSDLIYKTIHHKNY